MPVLTERSVAPLRQRAEAGLIHTGRRWTVVSVRQPGGSYVDTPTLGPPIPGLLTPVSADDTARVDQPSSAGIYWWSLPSGTPVTPGEDWQVEGVSGGTGFDRKVHVTRVEFPEMVEIVRRALVVDTASNP